MPAKKQIPKEKIIAAALQLLMEQGYEAVNITRLAEALGCSTQPIYLSFSGMEELRAALAPAAVAEFASLMKKNSTDASPRLYDPAYIRLAKEQPRLFRFLFMRADAFSQIRQALLPMIEGAVKELMDTYRIDSAQADLLHDEMWMHAHGIASMLASGFCTWDMEKAEKMLADCKRAFTKKYEASRVHK